MCVISNFIYLEKSLTFAFYPGLILVRALKTKVLKTVHGFENINSEALIIQFMFFLQYYAFSQVEIRNNISFNLKY